MRRKRWFKKIALGCGFLLLCWLLLLGLYSLLLKKFVHEREMQRQAHCISNLHFIGQAVALYREDNKAYPPFDLAKGGPGLKALADAEYFERVQGTVKELICYDSANTPAEDSYDTYTDSAGIKHVVYNYWGYGPDPGKWTGCSVVTNAVPDKRDRKRRYLANPWCPWDTIITHCCYHRAFYGNNRAAWHDLILYVNGSVEKVGTTQVFLRLKKR